MNPEDILATYMRVAEAFAAVRDTSLFERPALDALLDLAPGRRILDLGCGTGDPIGRYLARRGADLTAVDGAAPMLDRFRAALPGHEAVEADMRHLALGRRFDAIVAWDSFFHLAADDQRNMFGTFARHAAPGAALLFTSGAAAGISVGSVGGEPVFHESLDPAEYRTLLDASGFDEVAFHPDDPGTHGHSWWLARFRGRG